MTDPCQPDQFRNSWCGRFSIPFGLVLLESASRALGLPPPTALPLGFGASVEFPELPVRHLGLGNTTPVNLYHFVSYPGVVFTATGE